MFILVISKKKDSMLRFHNIRKQAISQIKQALIVQ